MYADSSKRGVICRSERTFTFTFTFTFNVYGGPGQTFDWLPSKDGTVRPVTTPEPPYT